MKYKNIRSAIHNFGHSFMSMNNYVAGAFIVDDLMHLHRVGHDLEIDWMRGAFTPPELLTPRLEESISIWARGITAQLAAQQVELGMLKSLRWAWPANGPQFMEAEDDRGSVHRIALESDGMDSRPG